MRHQQNPRQHSLMFIIYFNEFALKRSNVYFAHAVDSTVLNSETLGFTVRMSRFSPYGLGLNNKRMIHTEEKAKVVAAA